MQVEIKEVVIQIGEKKLYLLPIEMDQLQKMLAFMLAHRIQAMDGVHFVFRDGPFREKHDAWTFELNGGEAVFGLRRTETPVTGDNTEVVEAPRKRGRPKKVKSED